MVKKENILYFTDTYLLIYCFKKDQLYKFTLPLDIIKIGRIADYKKFIKIYADVLRKTKMNQGLFGENIKIIINTNYNKLDILVLKYIFNYFNYRKIKIEYELK